MKICVVVGNPKPKSRTLEVAVALVNRMFAGATHDIQVIDLVDHESQIFRWPSDEMKDLNEQVASSDLVVFASPTYKATYTGLLKAFLDRYPANGLRGVVAIPLLTGADLSHSMGPTVNLAPLLAELGAIVPGKGFYFVTSQMNQFSEIVDTAAEEYLFNLGKLAKLADAASVPQLLAE